MAGVNPFAPAAGLPKLYNSYVTDPYFARCLTAGWCSAIAVLVLCNLPNLTHLYVARKKWSSGWYLTESFKSPSHAPQGLPSRQRQKRPFWLLSFLLNNLKRPIRLPSLSRRPIYLPLNFLQLLGICLIPVLILSTLLPQQILLENPNRLGFFAVASLIPLFLFASKALLPFSALLSTSYVAVNFLHRWLGRAIFLLGLTHGSIWLSQYHRSGQLQEQLKTSRVQTGLANLALLFWLNISSLPIVRKRCYPVFFASHVIGFVSLLVTVNAHTPYALPWIAYGVVVIYGTDLGLRLCLSSSLAPVTVAPLEGGIARVWVHHLNQGWHAGQHVQLRLLFQPRVKCSRWSWRTLASSFRPFESHPYSITIPAQATTTPGFALYVRSQGEGTWSGDVNSLPPNTRLWAVIEGPYGPARDIASDGETCLAVCGGSGATWTLSMLNDLVEAPSEALQVRKVVVLWVVKKVSHIHWFLQHWDQLIEEGRARNLDVSVQIHVTQPEPSSSFDTDCEIVLGVGESGHPDLNRLLHDTVQDAINPCRQTSECTCGNRPGNEGCCPMDVESCCGPTAINEDEIVPLSACCQSSEESLPEQEKSCCAQVKKACCGRCDWDGITAVQPVPSLIRNRGLVVTVCGPRGMANSISEAVASLPLRQSQLIGGVKLIVESYRLGA